MSNQIDNDPFAEDVALPSTVNTTAAPPTESNDEVFLTNPEKKIALDAWNSGETSLKKIIQAVDPAIDARHKKGIAIKKYLLSLDIKPHASQNYQRKTDAFNLSEDHREFIRAHSGQMTALQIARELFNDSNLTNLSVEARAVALFYNDLDPSLRMAATSQSLKSYNPPHTHTNAMARINKYVYEGIDPNSITEKEKAWFTALIKYMHVHRYLFIMNQFNSEDDRELMESSFIRFTYNKPDLTEEEIDLYINLCIDIVNHGRSERDLEMLLETRDQMFNETGKVPVSIVQAISDARNGMDANLKRQKATHENLQGKRATKIATKLKENASVIQLVELVKQEKKRIQFAQLAITRKKKLAQEVDRLDSLDDLRFQLWGIGKEEILSY